MVYQALDSYRNYVGERAKLEAQLASARSEFFHAYQSGDNVGPARETFASLLRDKDYLIAYRTVFGNSMNENGKGQAAAQMLFGKIDNGIPADADYRFQAWVRIMQQQANDAMHQTAKPQGAAAVADAYQRYRVDRDWAEFDAQHIKPRPDDYLMMLMERYPGPKTPTELTQTISVLTTLFGKQALRAAAATVQELPKDDRGNCKNIDSLKLPASLMEKRIRVVGDGGDYTLNPASPYAVWVALLGRDDPIKRFAAHSYSGMHSDVDGMDWVAVQRAITFFKLSYGEAAVTAFAKAQFDGQTPVSLATTDLDGYIRSLLLNHDPTITDAGTLQQKFDALEKLAGSHQALLKAAGPIRDTALAGGSFAKVGAGVDDAYSALATTLQPVKANNPYYLAWTHFPVGSKAAYVFKYGEVSSDYTFELQEITPQRATIALTKRNLEGYPKQWSKAYPSTMILEAYYAPEYFAQSPAASLFARTGSEMWAYTWAAPQDEPSRADYPLDKTSLNCAVRMTDPNRTHDRIETRLMSDHVPGGLVSVSQTATNGTFLIGYSVVSGKAFEAPAESPTTIGQLAAVIEDPKPAPPAVNTTKADPPPQATPTKAPKKKKKGILDRIFK